MRIRTANRRKTREQRQRAAWNRKMRSPRVQRWIAQISRQLAVALDCPERPWFRLRPAKFGEQT